MTGNKLLMLKFTKNNFIWPSILQLLQNKMTKNICKDQKQTKHINHQTNYSKPTERKKRDMFQYLFNFSVLFHTLC